MEIIMELGKLETIMDIIKVFYINIFTYYINYKLINRKIETIPRNFIIIFIFLLVTARISVHIENILGFSYNVVFTVLFVSIIFTIFEKQRFAYSLLITVISLSINYITFMVAMFISYVFVTIFKIENIWVLLILILILYSVIIYILNHIKRVNKGLIFLQNNIRNEYIDILILNISIVILFCITILSNYNIISSNTFGFSFVIFAIIMFITIQKSLQLYYKQKLQERETEEIKEELKDKNKEIEVLQKENLKLNKINHSIAHKQKLLEYELNQLLGKVEVSDKLKNKVENLSKEMQKDTINVELTKTNINEIDNMLKYMQSECVKNKIDFELQINGNIHHMVNKYISKEDLEILLADHIKNAMIAIRHRDNINKSILVRLGIIDGLYSLYIYDSGIEFELETLINLGMKPSTTHKDDGGTGMGFMNTFDTLKKYNASIIIEEYGKPSKEKFTKVIKIIFDKENTYKISSYREKEIRKRDIEKRIEILK